MLDGIKNINDNNEYYVINLNELDIELNYGKDFEEIINNRDIANEISDLVDVYIINKQSHTIYYPKGMEYNGKLHFRLDDVYSQI